MIHILPYYSENVTEEYELFNFVYLHDELEDKYNYDLCLIKESDKLKLIEGIQQILVGDEQCLLFYWITNRNRPHGLIIYPDSKSYQYCEEKLKEKSERL